MLIEIKHRDKINIEEFIKFSNLFIREFYSTLISKNKINELLEFNTEEVISSEIKEGRYQYFLINFENQNIGIVSLSENNELIEVSQIFILKKFRNRGFSDNVIEEIKKLAKGKKLKLNIPENNKKLPEIIRKWGFIKSNSIAKYLGSGIYIYEDIYYMEI